jgi:hypothetical protein
MEKHELSTIVPVFVSGTNKGKGRGKGSRKSRTTSMGNNATKMAKTP